MILHGAAARAAAAVAAAAAAPSADDLVVLPDDSLWEGSFKLCGAFLQVRCISPIIAKLKYKVGITIQKCCTAASLVSQEGFSKHHIHAVAVQQQHAMRAAICKTTAAAAAEVGFSTSGGNYFNVEHQWRTAAEHVRVASLQGSTPLEVAREGN
jgi:hypothetical protein